MDGLYTLKYLWRPRTLNITRDYNGRVSKARNTRNPLAGV